MRKVISEWTRIAGRISTPTAPLLCIPLLIGVVISGMLLCVPDMARATGTINTCDGCHGNGPVDAATRDASLGRFPGSHNTHAGTWYTTTDSRYGIKCEVCHNAPNWTAFGHQGDTIQVNLRWLSMNVSWVMQNGSVPGWGSYSRGTSFTNWSTMPTSNFGICRNTYCHSNGAGGPTNGVAETRPITPNISPMWSSNTPGGPGCTPCHGRETGNPGNGAPWYTSGWQMTTKNWASFKANSHQAHAGSGNPCNKCHYATTNTGTTITSVGNHIKMNYSVTPGPGISYTYAYTSNGGTCSSVSCHGNGGMKWGTGTADCITCHSGAAFAKSLSIGTIRRVVGGDFNMAAVPTGSRHLYGATTIVKWDCIVCHREGGITDGKASASYHNEGTAPNGGLINLRNVDTTNEATGWDIDNERWTTTDYANLDQFCLSCHDYNGSSAVAVNATNNGLYTGTAAWDTLRAGWESMGGTFIGRAAMSPFNSTDWNSGFNAGSTRTGNAGKGRAKMVDARSQFYVNNPSQHAVLGQRYSTKNASWLTAAWTSYASKKTTRNLKATGEAALFSCADCHVLDAGGGAHGGTRKYNLWASTLNDGICARCHALATYANAGGTGSRYSHSYTRSGSSAFGLPLGATGGSLAACMSCHASFNTTSTVARQNSYGGIHGSWSSFANAGTAQSTMPGYRFFPGTWRRQNMTTSNYAGTTTGNCYFPTTTGEAFSACTSHSGTQTTVLPAAPGYARPVNY